MANDSEKISMISMSDMCPFVLHHFGNKNKLVRFGAKKPYLVNEEKIPFLILFLARI